MSAEAEAPVAASAEPTRRGPLPDSLRHVRHHLRTLDRYTIGLAAIVVAQAVYLAVLVGQGWYYQADFSNLVDGSGKLTLGYLTESQGGHLAIGDRLLYWVMYRTMPLDHGALVAIEVVVQAATTLLLARLLTLLVGRRPAVLAVVAIYSVSALNIQTLLWMTASVAYLPSQLFVLLALIAHVRYALGRRLRFAAWTAGSLFVAAAFSEQSVVIALTLPILSFGFLITGRARDRALFVLKCWPEWIMIGAPMVGFLGYFFGSGKFVEHESTGIGAGTALRVIGTEFRASVLPSFAGGPLNWQGSPGNYLLLTDPPRWLQLLGAGVLVVLLGAGLRRTGALALLAWSMPLIVAVVGITIVAVGRYDGFGMIIARQMEHSGYFAIPIAIAVCLSLWAQAPESIARRLEHDWPPPPPARRRRPPVWFRAGRGLAVLAIIGVAVTSEVKYADRWADNPAHAYVNRLSAELDRLGPGAALYDTPVNQTVIPLISPNHHVSDLVKLMGRSVRFNTPGRLLAVGADGSIGPAGLLVAARGVQRPGSGCALIARGLGDWTIRLASVPHVSEYVLRMSYLQPRASVIGIRVVGSDGTIRPPVPGARTELPSTLSTITLRLPLMAPKAILIHSGSLATNLCLSAVTIGAPIRMNR